MKIVVVGLGVQGKKRQHFAGNDFVAAVDPVANGSQYRCIQEVPLDGYDAALVCTPDMEKFAVLKYLLENGKHVLVEKPLWRLDINQILLLQQISANNNLVFYTAYNHRFEPHIFKAKQLIDSGDLGSIYMCKLFYGNGTARIVRDSAWRDKGLGVIADLGSHLLDIVNFWFNTSSLDFSLQKENRFENNAPDHAVMENNSTKPQITLEVSLLSWRNSFKCDIIAENGSVHIDSLCKWGPSSFIQRKRKLPSGRPEEESITLVNEDPTWFLEYGYFKQQVMGGVTTALEKDIWIHNILKKCMPKEHTDKVMI
jgi:scyllo-inositol 2-dehydrogenase (NADP+)